MLPLFLLSPLRIEELKNFKYLYTSKIYRHSMNNLKRCVLLGAGNVATHMGKALKNSGVDIVQVYSRTFEHARVLADVLGADPVNTLEHITTRADIFIMAVKDDVLASIAKELNLKDSLCVHTAGSIEMDVLESVSANYGVFYPLQTFSKQRNVDFSSVPLLVQGSNADVETKLLHLGQGLSNKVIKADSQQRKAVHLAAVFACNFVNHMFTISDEILSENQMDFSILYPLIQETVNKAVSMSPGDAQTGPAKRNDRKVMDVHLDALHKKSGMEEIYATISEHIFKYYIEKR